MIELDQIYKKDCREFMKELDSESLQGDIVVSSPPYSIRKTYEPYNDNKKHKNILIL